MKVLQVIECAYRATIEEQDDTIIWLTHAMNGAGADLDVLLRGDAVNYAVRSQKANPVEIGGWVQTQPPNHVRDVSGLVDKGVKVCAVGDDLARRGIENDGLIEGIDVIAADAIPGMFSDYDQVWHW